MLVDNAESEVDLICLLKVRLHAHDLGEGFFGVLQRPIPVVENAYAVPQFGFLEMSAMVVGHTSFSACLWIREVVQGLLICGVGFLQIVHHQVAVTEVAPCFAIVWLSVQDLL